MQPLWAQTEAASWNSDQILSVALWIGFAVFTLTLVILGRTRWTHAKPLSKCLALSVMLHLLLFAIAYTTRWPEPKSAGRDSVAALRMVDWNDQTLSEDWQSPEPTPAPLQNSQLDPNNQPPDPTAPWDRADSTHVEATPVPEMERSEPSIGEPDVTFLNTDAHDPTTPPTTPPAEPPWDALAPPSTPAESVPAVPRSGTFDQATLRASDSIFEDPLISEIAVMPELQRAVPRPDESGVDLPDRPIEAELQSGVEQSLSESIPDPNSYTQASPVAALVDVPDLARNGVSEARAIDANDLRQWLQQSPPTRLGDGAALPSLYRLRPAMRSRRWLPPDTTRESEAGVEAALAWIVRAQESDGRWDASRFGAGREDRVLGEDRGGAGGNADTAITGLALLALMGHGHTHLEGDYRESVQHGLEFLLSSQSEDGALFGAAEIFARMYSHSIASIALAEAYAMTGDPRLVPGVERALAYTKLSQHPQTGGWRYLPRESGDMSQFGWQVMALRAGEQSGFAIPESTRLGMHRFLDSCAFGVIGGRASYRPGEAASPTMTAESLACRYWLGMSLEKDRVTEAVQTILAGDPSDTQSRPNEYFLYYATLALHEHQGPEWEQWNTALQSRLLAIQERSGPDAGSWSPETRWGGYGGRVYTTAIATLCLEVPYRYIPTNQVPTN